MRFCELSPLQARLFETRGVLPNCADGSHSHVEADDADKLIAANGGYMVGRGRFVRSADKEWSGRRSAGFGVMQMVEVFRDKKRDAKHQNIPAGKHRAPRLKPGRSVFA